MVKPAVTMILPDGVGMSASVIALIILIPCLLAVGCLYWISMKRSALLTSSFPFRKAKQRKLSADELYAIERYLESLSPQATSRAAGTTQLSPLYHRLSPQGDRVYPLTHTITRYGLSVDDPNYRRYYLDNLEIHLPPFWEQFIADENRLEVIKTHSIPLVISINGHSLTEYTREEMPRFSDDSAQASIRPAESEQIELTGVRKETYLEHQLTQRTGIRESVILVAAMLLLYLSLFSPEALVPWLLALAAGLVIWGVWRLYSAPAEQTLKEVHCLRGIPKRWGLFGDSNVGKINNVSLGTIDLIYPAHWQNYIQHDLGQNTDIEMYLNRHVVRQGRFLSLHDEVKHFPLQRWGHNAVLACGATLILTLLLTTLPLSIPFKLSAAWIHGTHDLSVTDVKTLSALPLRVGDTLDIQGSGMCRVPAVYQEGKSYPFMPFDCSEIYWNTAAPLAVPSSDVIDNASALLASVNRQMNPGSGTEQKVNPQLASAIQKSGMLLLDDFGDIVLRAEDLCGQQQAECGRLKNALLNLGNSTSWDTLVKKAESGKLDGVNVLLRPASAQQLSDIVNSAVSSFYYRETRQAAQSLAVTPPNGFLIVSDEGKPLVNHAQPSVSLYDYNSIDQWRELENLSRQLLVTPFTARGVITDISTDANGTRHIVLHSEPDIMTLWRYAGTCLLIMVVVAIVVVNLGLLLMRLQKNMRRIPAIQHYYDRCINPSFSSFDLSPR